MTRRHDGEARRQELCDAAIELLARDGARGLTHLRVDRRAGVADGSTSFYFSTRAALVRAVTNRVVALDITDFEKALNTMRNSDVARRKDTLLSTLAEQAMRTADGPDQFRARARFELMMMAHRDPEVATSFEDLMDRFGAIGEQAVAQLQPTDVPRDETLIKKQAFAVMTFLAGLLYNLAYGITRMADVEQIEGYLHAIISGVAVEYERLKDSDSATSHS